MDNYSREEQVNFLLQGVDVWNRWRTEHPDLRPDLSGLSIPPGGRLQRAILGRTILEKSTLDGTNLSNADLAEANLHDASLVQTNLTGADLSGADLSGADLTQAILFNANLHSAVLTGATLSHANLRQANLQQVDLSQMDFGSAYLLGAKFTGAKMLGANLSGVDLHSADLRDADLTAANLESARLELANLSGATLTEAKLAHANLRQTNLTNTKMDGAIFYKTDLTQAQLIGTSLRHANLADCCVYGISTWDLVLENTRQTNLRITPDTDVEITSDDLEVAQFLYLLLYNERISRVIDTVTSKVVLILGRFTPTRKRVLDSLRDTLRHRNYLPVVFDFEKSANRDLTETISTLAHMSRFVIADLTDPRSIPQELGAIIPNLPSVAVQPLIQSGEIEYGMFEHWQRYNWVLDTYRYESLDTLLAALNEHVIDPAEARAAELQRRQPSH